MRRPPRAIAALLALPVLACTSMAPEAREPEAVAALPATYAGTPAGDYQPAEWWRDFGDPVLDDLVNQALAANLDLVAGVASVEEARARRLTARGGLLPTISGAANGSYQDAPLTGALGAFAGGIDRIESETYSATLAFAYELDFWGRRRSEVRAATEDLAAAEADLATLSIGVVSEVITTYFELVDLRARQRSTQEILEVLAERVDQTQRRYEKGLVSSFELSRVRQDYRNAQAGLPGLGSQARDAEGRLASLIARPAGSLDLDAALQPRLVFSAVAPGMPAELLIQRPDVWASARRLEAARHRVGASKAALFPTIDLSGSFGTQDDRPSGLLELADQWVLNFAGGLVAPIFQGGRLRADLASAEARYEQAAARYAGTVLTALREVESALARLEAEHERYRFLAGQLEEAKASTVLQADRYDAGVGQYTDYLDGLRSELEVERSLSLAGRDVALARLATYRALGGGWSRQAIEPRLRWAGDTDTSAGDPVPPRGENP